MIIDGKPVMLTPEQIRYLMVGPNAGKPGLEENNLVISDCDDKGWILVEQAATLRQEGSGVWVDPAGMEHYGSGEDPSPLSKGEEAALVMEAWKGWHPEPEVNDAAFRVKETA
jgi:hypothetical protein